MTVNDIIYHLETLAPPSLQEDYDNAGLLTGQPAMNCTGVLCSLDVTEEVIAEAIQKKCNLVVAHHPVIFRGLKKINGKNGVERVLIEAIRNDIAIYAIHTNLDNVTRGVNGRIAEIIGLKNARVLAPKPGTLRKIFTFVPRAQADQVREALFAAGGGHIGNYASCSFNTEGSGTFLGGEGTNPFVGEPGKLHLEEETRIEMVFPAWLEGRILEALIKNHPYEEVAYDIAPLSNPVPGTGSGLVGDLPEPMSGLAFLALLRDRFECPVIRHSALGQQPISRVALCGGAGSFLLPKALSVGAQAFVTADLKYHDFFEPDGRLLLADIGHFESEQFTTDLLAEGLQKKFPTFAVLKTEVKTNPVHYFK